MIDAPSGGAPEQAPRWDLMGTEGCGGGIRFLAPYLVVWGYVGIYRRKEYVSGATGGPRGKGRALGGQARPPPSWRGGGPPGLHLWRGFFIIYSKIFRGVSGHSENFCFCT